MYIFDINKLQPGDIILQRYEGNTNSEMIRKKTGSLYSHAMLYLGQSSIIEAGDIVETNNPVRILIEDPKTVCVKRLKHEYYNEELIIDAIVYAREAYGTEYSVMEAIRALKKPTTAIEPNRQICTRLVAQSFAKAGLHIVDNSDYCTTKDIEESACLFDVEDFLKEATQEDIDFADSYNVLDDQTEFTKGVLEKASALLNEDVQTIEQLTNMACKYPDKAQGLCDIVRESGYLNLWELEKDAHPHEYNTELFAEKYKDHLQEATNQTIDINESLKQLYEQNLRFLQIGCFLYGENAYLEMMINLYEKLIKLCNQRSMVAILALSKNTIVESYD